MKFRCRTQTLQSKTTEIQRHSLSERKVRYWERNRGREEDREEKQIKRKKRQDREKLHVPYFLGFPFRGPICQNVTYNLIKTVTASSITPCVSRIAIFRGAFFGVDHQAALEFELYPDASQSDGGIQQFALENGWNWPIHRWFDGLPAKKACSKVL